VAAYLPTEADSMEVDTGPGDHTVNLYAGAGRTIINMGTGTNTANVSVWAASSADITIEAGGGGNNQLNFGLNPNDSVQITQGIPSDATLADSQLGINQLGFFPIK
jgi:hypothetical protein